MRELALRRTADRVEGDVRAYRVEKSIDAIWKTGTALLACVGPRNGGEHIVRSTARLASQLGTDWHAIYVETPQLQRLPAQQREQILKTIKLAQDLGATTAVLSGNDIAREVCDYARSHNLSKIMLGRATPTWPWRQPHAKRIARNAPDVDLIEIGIPHEKPVPPASSTSDEDHGKNRAGAYLLGGSASLVTALLCWQLMAFLDLSNIAMLFLLVVVLVAVRLGRGPSVLATFVSVATLDFFFVPPQYTFAIANLQYLVTFAVMLAVGLITGHLTADLRFQARVASHREGRWRALYEYSRELSGALQTEQIFDTTRLFIARAFRAKATLLVPDGAGRLQLPDFQMSDRASTSNLSVLDLGIAQWAFDHAEVAGLGTDTLPACRIFYLPMVAPMRTRGVLAIEPEQRRWILIPEPMLTSAF